MHSVSQTKYYMDAYRKGLNGKWAAWASKRYRGHRVLPEGIFAEIQVETIREQLAASGSQTHT
ncbi:hypothetical protein F5146DRAFT_919494 [Armillaria mellea]|nr:hypothetical protein F5146DRAFT_919494 [Armillaria mellea]